jgi:hypothetical protein
MDYPLNDTWCVYFHAKDTSKNYSDNTSKLIEVNNIKDLWGTFNNIPKPTEMFSEPGFKKVLKRTGEIPNAVSLFRKSSYPSWEDQTNFQGFEWSIKKYKDFDQLNSSWIKLIAWAVGENFENSETLNGIRIVDCTIDYKIMYRIELWFSDKNHYKYFESKIKEVMNIPMHSKLLYRDHSTLKEIIIK